MTTSDIIALCALALSALLALLNSRRGARADAAEQARLDAKLEDKLDYLARGVDDIRVDVRALKSDISTHATKLAELESSCKSAHHRIDELTTIYRSAHPPDPN